MNASHTKPFQGNAEESRPAAAGFVALSRFVVANDMEGDVGRAFRERPHKVDDAPGFVRMEVLSPVDRPEEFWLVTWWTEERCFEDWHHSHSYHESHRGIPKGLKLVPGETRIERLTMVAD